MKDKLEQIWENAIAILEPVTIRAVMEQRCGLVAINSDNEAIIVVHDSKLMGCLILLIIT